MLLAVLKRQRQALCGLVEQLSSPGADGSCSWILQLGTTSAAQHIALSSSATHSRLQPAQPHDIAAGSLPDEQHRSSPQSDLGWHGFGRSTLVDGRRSFASDRNSSSSGSQSGLQQDDRNGSRGDSRAANNAAQPVKQPGRYPKRSNSQHKGWQEDAAPSDVVGYAGGSNSRSRQSSRERSRGDSNASISRLQPRHKSDRRASSSGRPSSSTPSAASADRTEPFGALQGNSRRREPREPRNPQHSRSAAPDAALLTAWLSRVQTLDALELLVDSNYSQLNHIHVSTAAAALRRIMRAAVEGSWHAPMDAAGSGGGSSVGAEQQGSIAQSSVDQRISMPFPWAASADADAATQRAHALLNKLAAKVLQDMQVATPRTLSTVVLACSQLNYSHPLLLDAVAAEVQRRPHEFQPMDLTGMVTGLFAMGRLSQGLAQVLLQQMLATHDQYQPRYLLYALCKLSKAGASSIEVQYLLQARLLPVLDTLAADECGRVLQLVEQQQWSNSAALSAAREAVVCTLLQRLGELSPVEAVALAIALQRGSMAALSLKEGLLQRVVLGLAWMSPAALVTAARNMVKHGVHSDALQQALHARVVPALSSLKANGVFVLAQVCFGQGRRDRQLLEAVVPVAATRVKEVSEGDLLPNMLYACAKLGVFNQQLFSAAAAVCTEKWASYTPRVLGYTLWAFAEAGVPVPQLFDNAAELFLSNPSSFERAFVLDLARSFAKAGLAHEELFMELERSGLAWLHETSYVSSEVASLLKAFAKAGPVDSALFPAVAAHATASLRNGVYFRQVVAGACGSHATLNQGAEATGVLTDGSVEHQPQHSMSSREKDALKDEGSYVPATLLKLACALSEWPGADPSLLERLAVLALAFTGNTYLTTERLDTLQSCLQARGLLGDEKADLVVLLKQACSLAQERESAKLKA